MESKKKRGSEEPRSKTEIKMQTYRMDLRTQGGKWPPCQKAWVREWHGHIYTTKCKIDS